MVGFEQIRRGAMNYVSRELAPLLGTPKGILLEAFAPAVIESNLRKYAEKDWIAATGFVDGNMVDIDEIYRLIKLSANGKWPIELAGFKFTENDLDKLAKYIREA